MGYDVNLVRRRGYLRCQLGNLQIDNHIGRVTADGTFTYVTDGLGTVRNVVDAGGTKVNSYSYKAYGDTRSKIEGIQNPYLYTGRRLDSHTGDYYYRARYYQPGIGRFNGVDRKAPGEMSYNYVGGNPVMFGDAMGLDRSIVLPLPTNPLEGGANIGPGSLYTLTEMYHAIVWTIFGAGLGGLSGIQDTNALDQIYRQKGWFGDKVLKNNAYAISRTGVQKIACAAALTELAGSVAELHYRSMESRNIDYENKMIHFQPITSKVMKNADGTIKQGKWAHYWDKARTKAEIDLDLAYTACGCPEPDAKGLAACAVADAYISQYRGLGTQNHLFGEGMKLTP